MKSLDADPVQQTKLWMPRLLAQDLDKFENNLPIERPIDLAMFLKIITKIKEQHLDDGIALIHDAYERSEFRGSLFLLLARAYLAKGEYQLMTTAIEGANQICDDHELLERTLGELSGYLKDFIDSDDGVQSVRLATSHRDTDRIDVSNDKGSYVTQADKILKRGKHRYDQIQFDGKALLVPKGFYSNYLNLGAPEVTVFCAVWSKEENKDELLRSHSRNLRSQTCTTFPLYIFDDGDVPDGFGMPHVVCLDPLTIYEAWNLAVKLAPTEYVLNLNLDDRLFSNSIALMKDFLEASDSDLVGGEWLINFGSVRECIDDLRVEVSQTSFLPDWPPREGNNLRLGSGTGERPTYGPATMWKRSTTGMGYPHLFKNGEQIRSIGDALFWHSLKQAGRTLKKIPLMIGVYHSDAANQSEFRSHNDHENVKGGWLWKV